MGATRWLPSFASTPRKPSIDYVGGCSRLSRHDTTTGPRPGGSRIPQNDVVWALPHVLELARRARSRCGGADGLSPGRRSRVIGMAAPLSSALVAIQTEISRVIRIFGHCLGAQSQPTGIAPRRPRPQQIATPGLRSCHRRPNLGPRSGSRASSGTLDGRARSNPAASARHRARCAERRERSRADAPPSSSPTRTCRPHGPEDRLAEPPRELQDTQRPCWPTRRQSRSRSDPWRSKRSA